jgi:small subunit ribosomal protein S16
VLEELGHYDPIVEPVVMHLDRERAAHWIRQGALVSPTVAAFLKRPEAVSAEAR